MTEVGKFYAHSGEDGWYYYVYGSRDQKPPGGHLKNELASLVCIESTNGDVAVIRSGPAQSDSYATAFTKGELAKTLEYYKTHDRARIFIEREKSRAFRSWGLPGGPGEPSFSSVHSFPDGMIGKLKY